MRNYTMFHYTILNASIRFAKMYILVFCYVKNARLPLNMSNDNKTLAIKSVIQVKVQLLANIIPSFEN